MANKQAQRYSGTIHLGQLYLSPSNIRYTPTRFLLTGIEAKREDGSVAVIRRNEWATYRLAPEGTV